MDNPAGYEESASQKRPHLSRKVLPTKPSTSVNSRLSMSGRMVERPSTETERGIKIFEPFFLEYALLAEFTKLKEKQVPGVYISPADQDATKWYGILFVREGPYRGGVFRFKVLFSDTFPNGDCPRVVFAPEVFHPAVSPDSGDLNVAAAFPNWNKAHNHVWQLLQYASKVFNSETIDYIPLNEKAAQLSKDDPDEFKQLALDCAHGTRKSLIEGSEDDLNYIKFMSSQSITTNNVNSAFES